MANNLAVTKANLNQVEAAIIQTNNLGTSHQTKVEAEADIERNEKLNLKLL